MDTRILENVGFSKAESTIYLALLELGSCTTGKIISKTNLRSSTIYHCIETLLSKGIISYIMKGKIKYFQAENPEILIKILKDKEEEVNTIIPLLKSKQSKTLKKNSAKIYIGLNGLKTAFEDILSTLKKGDTYYFFQLSKQVISNDKINLFFRNYHLKRAEKGINVKGIATNDCKEVISDIFKNILNSEIRYVTEFLPNGVIIYKDKLIILDGEKEILAVVIESNSIFESYKNFFEDKWKIAKKEY
jgi:sugar-specific transcriptional regulator TrmB